MFILIHGPASAVSNLLHHCKFPDTYTIGVIITDEELIHNHKIDIYNKLSEVPEPQKSMLIISEEELNSAHPVIPFEAAVSLFSQLQLSEIHSENKKLHKIINTTHDGMIAIDTNTHITLMNKQAEIFTMLEAEKVLGKPVGEVMPSSRLPRVLQSGRTEFNKKQVIGKNRTIITTRVPMYENDMIIGVLAVFRDITDIENMAEEVTNLKSIRTMLEAIIHSSDDAISVVDADGLGLLINPAYTRLTGLKKDMVIGKPATADITEGESIHMKVLDTGKAVRGARMKVGPLKRDVVVNAAPVIVDEKVKGSVGVIHDVSEMEELTSELEQAKRIIRTLEAKYEFADIIGSSRVIQTAVQQSIAAAKTPASILLQGESGTGKELFAHAIHNGSRRKYNKFVRVNCAALTESLLESELFGYEEGAFSGAKRGGKKGLFEEADKGSIFLDEIGEVSHRMQAKLLRVLQEKEIVRVGGTSSINIDVRIIAATNIQLEEKIEEGSFRADLYHRLNRVPVFIPALRDRVEDIYELSMHLLRKLNQDYGMNIHGLTEGAVSRLQQYLWPGNVRELENVLGRAIIHMPQHLQTIQSAHITLDRKDSLEMNKSREETSGPLSSQLEKKEREILQTALLNTGGNKTLTAKQLGISLRSLYYKLDKHQL